MQGVRDRALDLRRPRPPLASRRDRGRGAHLLGGREVPAHERALAQEDGEPGHWTSPAVQGMAPQPRGSVRVYLGVCDLRVRGARPRLGQMVARRGDRGGVRAGHQHAAGQRPPGRAVDPGLPRRWLSRDDRGLGERRLRLRGWGRGGRLRWHRANPARWKPRGAPDRRLPSGSRPTGWRGSRPPT